ncbi:MAG: hypothetical protein KC609_10690 [Myxococcales bacterium]|nr:hypothetical protein [Myxococcales bacterium]
MAATPTHPELNESEIAELRSQVSKKGMELNEKLTKLLAGKEIEIGDLDGLSIPTEKEDKRKKLKLYLDQVSFVLRRYNDGTFGHCLVTGRPIPRAILLESPWTLFHPDVPEDDRTFPPRP